jgi:hypothetical protein
MPVGKWRHDQNNRRRATAVSPPVARRRQRHRTALRRRRRWRRRSACPFPDHPCSVVTAAERNSGSTAGRYVFSRGRRPRRIVFSSSSRGIGGFVARLRPKAEPPRRQYLAWCRAQGVPWHGEDRDYGARGIADVTLIGDDSDVSVIAAHTSRMAIDLPPPCLRRSDPHRFQIQIFFHLLTCDVEATDRRGYDAGRVRGDALMVRPGRRPGPTPTTRWLLCHSMM